MSKPFSSRTRSSTQGPSPSAPVNMDQAFAASTALQARTGPLSEQHANAATVAQFFRDRVPRKSVDDPEADKTVAMFDRLASMSRELSTQEKAIEHGVVDGAQVSQTSTAQNFQNSQESRRNFAIRCAIDNGIVASLEETDRMTTEQIERMIFMWMERRATR